MTGGDPTVVALEPLARVLHHGQARRVVGRELVRSPERHLDAEPLGHSGDVDVVGGEHDAVDPPARECRLRGVGEERSARELEEVLPGDSLRPAAGGDEPEDAHQDVIIFCVRQLHVDRTSAVRSPAYPSP